MFFHSKGLQYPASPEQPDPLLAVRMQELLGGQFGEITVSMQYLLQGFNCRMPGKYKDLLLDIGTEELGHIEMVATMIARLLEGAPAQVQEATMRDNPAMAAVWGGMNPQHAIVAGLGPRAADSLGNPWSGAFAVASGNLLADFRANVTAESQGRLQATRIFGMTDDPGVKQMLSFMIARDTMHQNMWVAAIEQLKEDGIEEGPVPSAFPQSEELSEVAYQYWNLSAGDEAREGRWASGTSPDGKGTFEYVGVVEPRTGEPEPPAAAPELFTSGGEPASKRPRQMDGEISLVEKARGAVSS